MGNMKANFQYRRNAPQVKANSPIFLSRFIFSPHSMTFAVLSIPVVGEGLGGMLRITI